MPLPTLSASTALRYCEILIALALVLQTFELLALRKTFSEQGVWRWSVLKKEFESFSRPVAWLAGMFLAYHQFVALLVFRLCFAFALLAVHHQTLLVALFATSFLVCLRWRGTFNGGSDYMTLLILGALATASIFESSTLIVKSCLWYIAVQTCLSYFVAGVVKLKNSGWRSGAALCGYLKSPLYGTPKLIRPLANHRGAMLVTSWALIAFECGFPVALAHPATCLALMTLAFLFHLGTVYAFGLNRFLFAWISAYPALYHCSLV